MLATLALSDCFQTYRDGSLFQCRNILDPSPRVIPVWRKQEFRWIGQSYFAIISSKARRTQFRTYGYKPSSLLDKIIARKEESKLRYNSDSLSGYFPGLEKLWESNLDLRAFLSTNPCYCRQRPALWAVISRQLHFNLHIKVGDSGLGINIGFVCGEAGRLCKRYRTPISSVNVSIHFPSRRPANGL